LTTFLSFSGAAVKRSLSVLGFPKMRKTEHGFVPYPVLFSQNRPRVSHKAHTRVSQIKASQAQRPRLLTCCAIKQHRAQPPFRTVCRACYSPAGISLQSLPKFHRLVKRGHREKREMRKMSFESRVLGKRPGAGERFLTRLRGN